MLTNCFRFAPRDSVPGLIAKICKYLKEHPGWSEEELEEQIKQFIGQTGVESFNGRTGAVALNENDVNNLKIASAYFAEGDETINELDLVTLYNQGVRFVFTNWNSVTSGYDLAFVLEYFSGYNDVVYYPMANGSGGGNIISVNGKTGIVELNLSDILGDSGAQVKLCTAIEFTSNTLATWNAYYASGYRFVCVVNDESTAVDFLYVLKQDTNNHQPIMISSTSGESAVTSVNTMVGDVIIPVVDVSKGNSQNQFAKIFVVENEDYPIVPSDDSYKLGGKLPSYYAKAEYVHQLSQQIAADGSGAHNSIYRGKYLGSAVTDSQYEAISDGSFKDLFIGDYWTINGVNYRIAAFDYYLNTGNTACTAHHVTLVPDSNLYHHVMNDTDTTGGAYAGSKLYEEGLNTARATIDAGFGASHILTHKQYFANAVTDGYVSAGSWYDSTVALMTEQNVYGCKILGNVLNGTAFPVNYTLDKSQYPLFRFRPDLISNRQTYWLRDVVSNTRFADVIADGRADCSNATSNNGIRPTFSIVG